MNRLFAVVAILAIIAVAALAVAVVIAIAVTTVLLLDNGGETRGSSVPKIGPAGSLQGPKNP